ncbi:YbfB/YjiJ family MFS transporter [Pseudomonas yamanorum]|uniref:YbfB/YjiJ family MFS transporter n=1 Tax=Pseudomonas yamanorum TaxID=515393 RepID=A0ABU1CQB7_9PSED|nr:YbfB/YjiJ family MFS transporter [Pseudomonas yamanorum]MDR0189460.1 YbfB/YjiJ family MFS transporter [Pseudomonas yamanorum]
MTTANLDTAISSANKITSPWAIAIAGLVSLSLAMSLGRFVFTPLLPMMLRDGAVTLDQGGTLATMNYFGYFVGAMLCFWIRAEPARIIRAALAFTVLLTIGMVIPGGAVWWAVWRTIAGICCGLAMVLTTVWSQQWLAELGRPTLSGIMFCGPGVGIVITSVPAFGMVAAQWPTTWCWIAFTILGVAMLLPVWRILGTTPPARPLESTQPSSSVPRERPKLTLEIWALTLTYGLGGFGYIITATFLPVIARHAIPDSPWVDLFLPVFGIGVAVGALLVTRIGMHHDNRRILMFLYAVQSIGVGTAAIWPTATGLAISSVMVGLPFTAIVAFAMREARRLWKADAAKLIGLMTAAYAIGQIAGPPMAMSLVAHTSGFSAALGVAAVALLFGSLAFLGMWRTIPIGVPTQS